MRALCRSIAFGGVIVLAALMGATSALAHATYKSSNPGDETTVSTPPSQITAEFSEPMSEGSYMDVTDPCGRDVGSGSSQTGSSMSVQNSGTAAGTYVVFWRAVSIDTHPTEGEFTFTSSGGDACPGEEEVEAGGGNRDGGDSSDNGGSADGGGDSTDGGDAGSTGGHADHSKGSGSGRSDGSKGDGRGRGSKGSGGGDDPTTALADGPRSDVPDAPSALEGIPIDGLLITLAVAALIGAAAGKIYVSLSGDE